MTSQGDQHDEFDYEFLGNTSGEPYVVQTNVYSKGVGNKEQRIFLWFDPTANFHSYSFLWNRPASCASIKYNITMPATLFVCLFVN